MKQVITSMLSNRHKENHKTAVTLYCLYIYIYIFGFVQIVKTNLHILNTCVNPYKKVTS